jgi:hypothetical protein
LLRRAANIGEDGGRRAGDRPPRIEVRQFYDAAEPAWLAAPYAISYAGRNEDAPPQVPEFFGAKNQLPM